MSREALFYVHEHCVPLGDNKPKGKSSKGEHVLRLIFHNLVSHAKDPDLLAYPSPETQARETGIDERAIRRGRNQLQDAGLMVDTGKKMGAAKVWQLYIPGYVPRETGATQGAKGGARGGASARQTEQNRTRTPHTENTLRRDKVSTVLTRVGVEYAKHELQKALEQGQRILSPEAWKKTVSQKVSKPEGELYEAAGDLVASNPGLLPDQLAELLIKAEHGVLKVTAAEKLGPELDTALSAVMGIAKGRGGMEAAMEYCKEHLAHLVPELLLHPTHLTPELLAAITKLNWNNARNDVA